MPTMMKQQAIDRLRQAIASAHPDDLVEIYSELFPGEPAGHGGTNEDPAALAREIAAHIEGGLEVEEILDLWNVVFPAHRGIWYDDEEGLIHYDETIERVGQAE